ncbi:hypothetical protein [Rivularia sp. UHCC 0363]|uniref:hypothetical protein n=1 Tax=Rivularia sp. UHCC 0363 TaxID=3110244 RepID=UPI002B2001D0|nr:hypothetical protein [Rivularia sp. UHCC 0363]MEA5594762.1 hypothetical protein [Rivularia sp. UHCC 0363]
MKNFTISLYTFHLRHSLTDAPDEVDVDANLLWENLAKLGENSLLFSYLKDLRSKLICYHNGNYYPEAEQGMQTEWLTDSGSIDLGSISTTEGFRINAKIQPFVLNDTYAADLTLFPESPHIPIDVAQLQHFQPTSLLPHNIQASLGQTLWIYGEVDANENCQELANQYAVALFAGTNLNPVFIKQGEIFGSLLFEYEAADPDDAQNLTKKSHILICLNNNQAQTPKLAGEAYDWLLNLLCCRHKILYIYQQARNRYPEARVIYSYLEKKIKDFSNLIADSQDLQPLKELLAEMPQKSLEYARSLQDLESHYTAISTNISNYKTCLEKITAIGGDTPKFWQDFLNRAEKQWQQQIETYLKYLTPGQNLFEQMIGIIRGIVEVEQAKRDRSLENTIQRLGIAFGGGAIVSGVVTQHIDKPFAPGIINFKYPVHPLASSLLWSFVATTFFWFLAWLFTKPKRKRNIRS